MRANPLFRDSKPDLKEGAQLHEGYETVSSERTCRPVTEYLRPNDSMHVGNEACTVRDVVAVDLTVRVKARCESFEHEQDLSAVPGGAQAS